MMKLFLLSQTILNGYDTYDSCVVVAEDVVSAVLIHPSGRASNPDIGDWPARTIDITCEYLGEAHTSFTKPAVICASFNAG
jgi:hypothetical protein